MNNRRYLAVAFLATILVTAACKDKEKSDDQPAAKDDTTQAKTPPATDTAKTDEAPAPDKGADKAPDAAVRSGAIARFEVEDFDAWKKIFDSEKGTRQEAGMRGHHVHQDPENKNLVTLYVSISDVDKFKTWLGSDHLKETMKKARLKGPPKISVVNLVADDKVAPKPGAEIWVNHEVEDFDKWYEGYNSFDEQRTKLGVTGHAVARSADNPSMVVVYHQAESVDTLKKFVDSSELKEAMSKAGVKGKPEISFTTSSEPFIEY